MQVEEAASNLSCIVGIVPNRYMGRPDAPLTTVNSEIFARIIFSRIALKNIFATLKIRE